MSVCIGLFHDQKLSLSFYSVQWRNNRRGDDRDLTLEDWLLIFIEFFIWNCDFTLEDRMPVFIDSIQLCT